MRYFHLIPSLSDAMVATVTDVDYVHRMALVATVGADTAAALRQQEIVGMVNYDRICADAAEVAFVVEDAWQGRGVASTLLYDVAVYARECGYRQTTCSVYASGSRVRAQHCVKGWKPRSN